MAVTQTDSDNFNGGIVANDTTFLQSVTVDGDLTVDGTATIGTLVFEGGEISGDLIVDGDLAVGGTCDLAGQVVIAYVGTTGNSLLRVSSEQAASNNTRLAEFYSDNLNNNYSTNIRIGQSASKCATLQYDYGSIGTFLLSADSNTDGVPTYYLSYNSAGYLTNNGLTDLAKLGVTFTATSSLGSPLTVTNTISDSDSMVGTFFSSNISTSYSAAMAIGLDTSSSLFIIYKNLSSYFVVGGGGTPVVPTSKYMNLTNQGNVTINGTTATSGTSALYVSNNIAALNNARIAEFYGPNTGPSYYGNIRVGVSASSSAMLQFKASPTPLSYWSVSQNTDGLPTSYASLDNSGNFVTTGSHTCSSSTTALIVQNSSTATNNTIGTFYCASLGAANYTGINLGIAAATCGSIQYINSATPLMYLSVNQNTTGIPTSYVSVDSSGDLVVTGTGAFGSNLSNTSTATAIGGSFGSTNTRVGGTNYLPFKFAQTNMSNGDLTGLLIGKATATSAQIQYNYGTTTSYLYLSVNANTVAAPTNYWRIDNNGNVNQTGQFSVASTKFIVASDGQITVTPSVGGTGTSSTPQLSAYSTGSWTPTITQLTGTSSSGITVNYSPWSRYFNQVNYSLKISMTLGSISSAETQTYTISLPFSQTFANANSGVGVCTFNPASAGWVSGMTGVINTTSSGTTLTLTIRVTSATSGACEIHCKGDYLVV